MTDKVYSIEPIPTAYNGVLYRSRTEARWAVFFDAIGLAAQYEAEGLVIRQGAYLPDFWLPGVRMFMEVKGVAPSEEECAKCASLTRDAECDVLLAVGAPEEKFQIRWFDREGQRPGLYCFAHDRYAAAGFWLVGEEASNCIGPTDGTIPAGPLFFSMERAYATARSARFGGRMPRVPTIQFPADAYERAA